MTPKQILDSFSDTLMQDERIISAQERALLTTLLQHAKAATSESLETQEAVRTVIASAVGETVAQRAFAVLGGSIVERILGAASSMGTGTATISRPDTIAKDPQPPRPAPPGPGVRKPSEPQSPGHQPQPPRPMGDPQPPRPGPTGVLPHTTVAVAQRPAILKAQCVVLDEFLAPQELEELTRFTLEHERDFTASEVVSPIADGGVVNYDHRRSRVLMDLGRHQDVILERIKSVLPQVLERLGMDEFPIAGVEAQITASNDGDFFHFHRDNGSDPVANRHLTFVYFFQREPKRFEGGELRIHDSRLEQDGYIIEDSYQAIAPRQNQIVFFPCELMHEITPVKCDTQNFADSRFTLNGWLRR